MAVTGRRVPSSDPGSGWHRCTDDDDEINRDDTVAEDIGRDPSPRHG
jgi:hypothetical protein